MRTANLASLTLITTYLSLLHQASMFPALNHPQARDQASRDHLFGTKAGWNCSARQSCAVHWGLPCLSFRNPPKLSGSVFAFVPVFCHLIKTWHFVFSFVFQIPHTSDIIQYLSLFVWLTSLSVILSRYYKISIHVITNSKISCFLMTK